MLLWVTVNEHHEPNLLYTFRIRISRVRRAVFYQETRLYPFVPLPAALCSREREFLCYVKNRESCSTREIAYRVATIYNFSLKFFPFNSIPVVINPSISISRVKTINVREIKRFILVRKKKKKITIRNQDKPVHITWILLMLLCNADKVINFLSVEIMINPNDFLSLKK